ncbi:cell division protein FtsZ [Piscinibacter sp.]|jgi:hypothetical protein|uniref:cell division protein FtsZ n=1 Tax=Piscinibacter sp. TaxID=1903157 RepID=UPI002F41AF43
MTSSLTVALAALGGVVLAGVVAHGAWQARKAGPRRAAVALPRSEPHEPTLETVPGTSSESPAAGLEPPRVAKRAVARLDALIDAIAPLALEAPVSGEMVLMHLPPTRRAGSKPFIIEGLNAENGEWEAAAPGQRYSEFQAGVQLANRTGALNEIEYSEFVQKVETFAEAIGARADVPDMLDVVARARELDAFAGEHDAQLAVHLQARSAAWSVGYIQQHAARHGFVPGVVPGRLVLPSTEEGAPPVLTLTFDSQAALADDPHRAAVRDVTLSFDVPQTDPKAEPFVAWQASAQALSLGMDAGIVDDNARALSPEGFAAIGKELEQLYRTLESRDLAAGSAAARRLFS